MVVEGILTNIQLHRELMVDARFIEGGTNIHYLEQKLANRPDTKVVVAPENKADA
jgi:acetyl-CoA carboxylase biotin carboxylase subunit